MERKYCQSCGMPLIDEKELGTNKDGSRNEEYCIYCFEQGDFKGDMTMEEMIAFCAPFMVKSNPNMTEEEAKDNMRKFFPCLKRWRNK
ncbi:MULTISPECIES: zinc ribbon domain-containing protein [Clostridium]|uniref:Putative zinc ribbon domain-containing protein n=1 Tax=Clostridium cadaveris TaxID=1529 RepID=A0A1I2JJ64_9CLOT|nr:zinc ribbon domain-containing protein [Clostridium cadaveris]MDU4953365.1 zinc ribbon domain-containing protein [Clostridium sp.]MDM8311006.1 zinc ribbon domain-containing protein [Clostridium cadaveris]MDY4949060.1 zinc ribbon domain-containing protein [Clostridium cadaveris]PWL51939.1 MAG: transcriptional regulator [Clostridium cadaveris]UFH66112.1 zinc ribbon domain-containing protein [Clostridium cadaveris]